MNCIECHKPLPESDLNRIRHDECCWTFFNSRRAPSHYSLRGDIISIAVCLIIGVGATVLIALNWGNLTSLL